MWETYYTPKSLDEALTILADYQESARIIAGGTDLLLEMKAHKRPGMRALIDISRIPGLDEIRQDDTGRVHLGPMVTHADVVASPFLGQRALPLAQAAWWQGSPQIRNRATVAGNLITASPSGDTIAPLIALEAHVTLRSLEQERTIPLETFYVSARETILRPDEMLVDVSFRPLDVPSERGAFVKLGLRRTHAISIVNAAAVIRFRGNIVMKSRIALGGIAPTVVTMPDAERSLAGKTFTREALSQAADLTTQVVQPIDDVRASANYRREMARTLTKRVLRQLRERSEFDEYPVEPVFLSTKYADEAAPAGIDSVQHSSGDVIQLTLNGKPREVKDVSHKMLLHVIRDELGLTGTKPGCGEGECGACTVFLDGSAVMSCLVPAPRAHQAEVVTIEGLAQNGKLHPVQQAFIERGAVQCGYCTPGFVMAGAKLLDENPNPSLWAIRQSLTGNLCRCTGYYRIVDALERATELQNES
ncbi:MAG: 2Fe-2S iron-sulfur cluster binding domain-containing protein [Chloroflexi bacterium]|nr:2Fe-2S iron-sulfur cluster binding domain-containing protein [Chloroflexota bacterium]